MSTQEKFRILLVDDNLNNLKLISELLVGAGYEVIVAKTGESGIKKAERTIPDLILLDVRMPGIDGFETCRRLKSSPLTQSIPIIFLTAVSNTELTDKLKGLKLGAVDFITKPIQPEEVIARVDVHLRLYALTMQLKEQNERLQLEIQERQRAEMESSLMLMVSQAINRAPDLPSAFEALLYLVCQSLHWVYGEAWIPNKDGTVLRCIPGRLLDSGVAAFQQQSQDQTFARGVGLPGRIWVSQQSEWIEDCSSQPERFVRSGMAQAVGLKAALGVPIALGAREAIAVLVFYSYELLSYQTQVEELVRAVATQIASLIQRKEAEEAKRLAELRYHNLVENAVEGIYQSTPSGRFLSANPALSRMYGYASPEDLMQSIKEISQQLYVDAERRSEFVAAMDVDNAVTGFEARVYRKDGTAIWISESARAVRDSQGTLLYYEGTVSDISDRKQAQETQQRLLLNILPEPIAVRLQSGESPIADYFEEASVLFADLVGFTSFASQKTPAQLVEMLNVIFSEFDQLATQYGLEKIKTIGDSYMVVGGLPIPDPDRAAAIARMALDMQATLAQYNRETQQNLQLRIGIHMGPVVAGVIGISKFSYDLWGDTVNIASRLESSSLPGRIQVTATVRDRLGHQFCFEERGTIELKGKGQMLAYWLKPGEVKP
ncbi:MAG: adenylate/guanylate cyclase domain-containing protein [Cyanobacteriota bacterium]|nr:adenylate/guanylate cyclase domain-containing protein [Cyanobacteriota bacterium]